MFKIGDKAKGFKFDNPNENGVHWDAEMDFYVDKIGEIVETYNDAFVIQFGDTLEWMYPLSLAHLAVVEEKTTFNIGDKVVPFRTGDKVRFKKSSLASGMIDASEEDLFTVQSVSLQRAWLKVKNTFGYYSFDHLEHIKEETMNTNEEQAINWEIGQEVFCLLRGKGVVCAILDNNSYRVEVEFEDTVDRYTVDGRLYEDYKARTLFFSEPKIEAELFPPKKPFVPVFKKGDVVVVKWADTTQVLVLSEETEKQIKGSCGQVWDKDPYVHFFKLGEEIKFS